MPDTLFAHKTDASLIADLKHFGLAQEKMAADSNEDMTHWHHVALAHLLFEAARRLENCAIAATRPTQDEGEPA